jgi:RNA recognition motif-containing protein
MSSIRSVAAEEQPEAKRRRVDEITRGEEDDSTKRSKLQDDQKDKEKVSAVTQQHSKKVYVGNLHHRVAKVHLEKLLQPYGTVVDIHVCYHKNGQPRGFAFCEFANKTQAAAAIQALHGRSLLAKSLVVSSAKQREDGTNQNQATSAGVGSMNSKQVNDKIEKLKKALNVNR